MEVLKSVVDFASAKAGAVVSFAGTLSTDVVDGVVKLVTGV